LSEIQVLDGCEEFALGSGPTGALLVHGFTGSPQGMRGLGEYLSERGIAVVGPRLPGHGTTWQDCNTRRAEDWIGTVEASFDHLASEVEEVFLVGLSFGAALCLDLAARRDVAGVVTLAGMVHSKDPLRHVAPVLSKVIKSLPGVGNDIADPEGKEIAYDRLPAKAAYQLLRQMKTTQAALPKVTAPVLVIHGRQDHTVPSHNAEYIIDHIGSSVKELVYLEDSFHVITLDREKDFVFERTYDFIKEHAKHGV
jgi:carboxylesterase